MVTSGLNLNKTLRRHRFETTIESPASTDLFLQMQLGRLHVAHIRVKLAHPKRWTEAQLVPLRQVP